MKTFKNKIFVTILFLTVAFSPMVAPRAHAGDIGSIVGIVLSGGLLIPVLVPQIVVSLLIGGYGLTLDNLGTVALNSLLGIDVITSIVLCGEGVTCVEGDDKVAVILTPTTPPESGFCGAYSVPLTFYIPAFNKSYVQEYCYENSTTPLVSYCSEYWPTNCTFGYSDIVCTRDFSSLKTYRGPVKPQYYEYMGWMGGEPGYAYDDRNGSVTVLSTGKTYSAEEANCLIPDPNGTYVKKASDGKCAALSEKSVLGTIDETKNKIAIYRTSVPVASIPDNNTLGYWFMGSGGVGGALGRQFGNGWTMPQYDGMSNAGADTGYYTCCKGYSSCDPRMCSNKPLRIVNYSDACKGNVCTFVDSDNVPQDSYVVYAAKILGDYNYGRINTNTEYGDNYGLTTFSVDASTAKPDKFLSKDDIAILEQGSIYGLALLPALWADSYHIGNTYIGPVKTGTLSSNCQLTVVASPGGTITGNTTDALGNDVDCKSTDGINPATCTYEYPLNSVVNLKAASSSASNTFSGWSGFSDPADETLCKVLSQTEGLCNGLVMNSSKTINADFNLGPGGCPDTDPCQIGTCVGSQCINADGCIFDGTKIGGTCCPTTDDCQADTCIGDTCQGQACPSNPYSPYAGEKNCSKIGTWKEVAP